MVRVANSNSNMLQINSGVPQGSILGPSPLLFLIYVKDLTWTCPEVDIDLYANDSTMYKSGSDLIQIQNELQENLFRVHK